MFPGLFSKACGLIKNGQVLRVLAPEIQSIMPPVEPWLVKVAELAASCVNDNVSIFFRIF